MTVNEREQLVKLVERFEAYAKRMEDMGASYKPVRRTFLDCARHLRKLIETFDTESNIRGTSIL